VALGATTQFPSWARIFGLSSDRYLRQIDSALATLTVEIDRLKPKPLTRGGQAHRRTAEVDNPLPCHRNLRVLWNRQNDPQIVIMDFPDNWPDGVRFDQACATLCTRCRERSFMSMFGRYGVTQRQLPVAGFDDQDRSR